MRTQQYRRILVSGVSGAGKSTLVKRGTEEMGLFVDLDDFGWGAQGYQAEPRWTVNPRSIAVLDKVPADVWAFGWCNNMLKGTDILSHSSLWPRAKVWHMDPVAYLPLWTTRIFMVYDPTEEELSARFGLSRENEGGKDPRSLAIMLPWLQSMYEQLAPRGFTKLDVTGVRDPDALLDDILEIVLSSESGTEPCLEQARVSSKGSKDGTGRGEGLSPSAESVKSASKGTENSSNGKTHLNDEMAIALGLVRDPNAFDERRYGRLH